MQSPPPAERCFLSRVALAVGHAIARPAATRRCLARLCCLVGGFATAAAAHALPWSVQVRNAAGQPLPGAVVAVEVDGRAAKAPSQASAQMVQRQRQFQPAVLVIQTGTAVSFPNFDTVRHHVYSFSATKTFDIKLYTGTPAQPVVFDKPGVAALGCNIHDRMSAHIVVVDTPLFGLSDADGRVQLDLPPGRHRLLFWHPRLGDAAPGSQPLEVGTDNATAQLRLEVGD